MALIIEDGTGKSDADSVIDAAWADTYFDGRGDFPDWRNSQPEEKAVALRVGAQYLEEVYAGQLSGARTVSGQALSFPRSKFTIDGNAIASNAIPDTWKKMTAEAALRERMDAGQLFARHKQSG